MTTSKATTKEKKVKQESIGQAKLLNHSSVMSVATSEVFVKNIFPDLDINEAIEELSKKIHCVQSGELKSMEAMLVGQASALQSIFTSLARRAVDQDHSKNYSMLMNLALKAQGQCRSTIQALTELKYPKQVAYVKQANIANGHQQINNSQNVNQGYNNASCAENNQNQPNELLEANNGSTEMDDRATKAASRENKEMATVEK